MESARGRCHGHEHPARRPKPWTNPPTILPPLCRTPRWDATLVMEKTATPIRAGTDTGTPGTQHTGSHSVHVLWTHGFSGTTVWDVVDPNLEQATAPSAG